MIRPVKCTEALHGDELYFGCLLSLPSSLYKPDLLDCLRPTLLDCKLLPLLHHFLEGFHFQFLKLLKWQPFRINTHLFFLTQFSCRVLPLRCLVLWRKGTPPLVSLSFSLLNLFMRFLLMLGFMKVRLFNTAQRSLSVTMSLV